VDAGMWQHEGHGWPEQDKEDVLAKIRNVYKDYNVGYFLIGCCFKKVAIVFDDQQISILPGTVYPCYYRKSQP